MLVPSVCGRVASSYSTKGQTRRKAGTQRHGALPGRPDYRKEATCATSSAESRQREASASDRRGASGGGPHHLARRHRLVGACSVRLPAEPSPVDSVDLTAALAEAQRGDQRAIALLFRTFQPPLLRYLRHYAPDVAEDLAAECWLAVSKVLATFEGDAQDLRAWLFGVARHQVANHYRSRRRRLRLWRAEEPIGPILLDPADVVVNSFSAQEAVEALARSLPHDQAEVVLLRVVAGLSVGQVATMLGRSPGSVRVTQHRALRRLARTWQQKAVTRSIARTM